MRFRATVQLEGKTATGIQIPDAVIVALSAENRTDALRAGKKTH